MKLSINVLNEIWPEAVFVGDFNPGNDNFDELVEAIRFNWNVESYDEVY